MKKSAKAVGLGFAACLAAAAVTIDGAGGDADWQSAEVRTLSPAEAGVPADLGGDVRVMARGGYLHFAGRFPEPGGKVVARSFGRNPVWDADLAGSPPTEDRAVLHLSYGSTAGASREVSVAVNPWGAYRVEERGRVLDTLEVLAAAQVSPDGWTAEAALPLGRLGAGTAIRVRVERIRSRRPLAPEFRWSAEAPVDAAAVDAIESPRYQPPALGNTDPPFEIGRVLAPPELVAQWDHPEWRHVPAFSLPRNEPLPRAPRQPTEVRWVHDGRTLSLLVRAAEPEPVVARAGGRDSNVTSDDHVAVYLATSGSAFLEIAVNSVGAIADARGSGPHRMRPQSSWNAGVRTHTEMRHGHWIARIDIPLDECAAALGERIVPRDWRMAVVRFRAARPGDAAEQSALPAIGGSASFYGPIRYRRALLSDADPSRVARVRPEGKGAAIDPDVWTASYRRFHGVRNMVARYLEKQTEEAVLAERRDWEKVRGRPDWEAFRDERLNALRESVGVFPPVRPPLDARVTGQHTGDGYRLENVVFQSRQDWWMTANLYLPRETRGRVPGMVIVHSHHYPKTQGELHDMGELWARAGAAVLVMERPGFGERAETSTWYRQAYGSRFNFTKQLFLVGESYSGWAAWDVIRSVDYLVERAEIDAEKIIVLGSVAGGGEPAGVAAALDTRIAAVVPFNYDQGHVRVHGDSPGQIARQFSPWLAAASIAPRRFVRAFEFGWEGAEEPDYPQLWFDGLERSKTVWGFYNAADHLATIQGYGLIRLSMERVSHCFSIGPQHRVELYPLLQRWFGIALPSARDLAILPDSLLGTNPQREEARRQEAQRRRPHADLLSMTPQASAQVRRRKMHELARDLGERYLREARAAGGDLRDRMRPMLGDIEPARPQAQTYRTETLPNGRLEAVALRVEDGIDVPLLLLTPRGARRAPVVVAVAQGGKARFLAHRGAEIEALLRAGAAVCLADVRATGETWPGESAVQSLAQREFDLGRNLMGSRLKDLRTVLAYLRTRPDVDARRVAVWGESFAPPNPAPLFLDELESESGPQIQHRADPTGAHLALLAALYEPGVRAVAARGGLSSYLSVLDDAVTYVPMDAVVLGILKAGDVEDLAAAIAPRPVLREGTVNGRNIADGPGPRTDVAAWLTASLR
ncbi:MAG: acetylxylan esterase [Bryobacterales bacterium]|nr:acetylxylan esterase [Bryobacterales bacterium]